MTKNARTEYRQEIERRYRTASKQERGRILDEFCAVCQYNRKYAIRVLNHRKRRRPPDERRSVGRPHQYTHPHLIEALHTIWKCANLPCGKRLKAILPLWVPFYECGTGRSLEPEVVTQLCTISAATIDRLLVPHRSLFTRRGMATTKPGSLIKKHIAIKTRQWDESRPGFVEADTVAHCGSSTEGLYVSTLNLTDIATGWTEQYALWSKGQRGVKQALMAIEKDLPFPLRGFDADNGSEFLNWVLYEHFRRRRRPVDFTRSREYQKNDNAHVEQKNWTHVRQYLGYARFDDPALAALLNDLYRNEWRLVFNFFIPSVKLQEKQRIGAHIIKHHDAPQTPYQRLLLSPSVPRRTKRDLQRLFSTLNPFHLVEARDKKIKQILSLVFDRPR